MANSYNEELKIGDRIGRYEILSVLGSGSMGMVYKCRHDVLGRIVAIKTLRLQRTTDDRTQKRFVREAQMANRLNHPNLIGLVDFGNMANNDPYLVMEFVSGQSLYEIMKRERYLIPERAVALFSQVADGLYHAHQRGVIHRDLKPANMLVVKNDDGTETVKIVDLGVAKIVHGSEDEEAEAITMTGEVCGSPIYLSPEQCMYQELDARTDIYSLGVCLYECLTGTPPLRGATVYDTIYMHVHDTPRPFHQVAVNPDIPKRLEDVVLRCLAKQPKDRYDTMIHLKKELLDSLKPSSAAESGIKVLPPEQLFSGGTAAPKRPPEPPGAGTGAGARQEREPAERPLNRESGKTSGKQDVQSEQSDEAEVRNNRTPKKAAAPSEAAVRGHEAPAKGAKSKKIAGKKSDDKDKGIGSKLAALGLDSLNPKTLGLLASMALVFFGFGSVFAFFLLKTTQAPPAVSSSSSNQPGSQTNNNSKDTPSANPAPKPSAFVEPDVANAPVTEAPGLLDKANALAAAKLPSAQASAKQPSPKPSSSQPKPQQSLSFNQMNNLLDSADGSQGRFNSIVEQVPSHPVSAKSKQAHGSAPANQFFRQYHLKAGRHMPPARPMPVLRRTPFSSGMPNGQMGGGGPMGGMGGPMGGMGGPMGGMGGPMGGMGGGGPMGGMGGGGPMGGIGAGGPMGGMGGASGGHGGGLLAKIQDFIASQSGGTIPPSSGNQNSGMNGGGAPGGNNVLDQQAALSKEGTQLCESKQWAAACQKYEQAYKLNPNNMEINQMYAYALNSYAVQLNKQAKYKEAVQYEKRAVTLYPDNPRYASNLHNFSENAKNQAAGAL